MIRNALYVRMEAKPGKENEVIPSVVVSERGQA